MTPQDVVRLTVERQGLHRRTGRLEPVAAIERFGPLHASDHRTPYLSLLARVEDFAIADLDRAWLFERRLDRRTSMRGTLHLLPAARLPDTVCSFGPARPEDHRALREAAIPPLEARRFRRAVESILEREGPLELSGLKRALPANLRDRATEKTAVGPSVLAVVVRWMTEAGVLALGANPVPQSPGSPSGWGRAPQAYERFDPVFGPLPPCRRDQADARLVRWYFEAHGPAAFEDWAWWTGFPAARSAAAFERIRSELDEVAVAGWPERVYLPAGDLERAAPAAEADGPVVRLLPYEDAALKAYRSTRRRFFDPDVGERQHTLFGEVLPTVLVDGTVVGTWSSGARGWAGALGAAAGRPDRGLAVELFVPVAPSVHDRLDAELARLRAALEATSPDRARVDAPPGGG